MLLFFKDIKKVLASYLFFAEVSADSISRYTMRRLLLTKQLRILILFVVSFFSHMAYSVDSHICQPTGFVNRIYINVDITITSPGSVTGVQYVDSTPVARPGPVTCPNYTPTGYTVLAMSPSGMRYPSAGATVDLSQGFSALLGLSFTPGLSNSTAVINLSGNTPNIESNIYPAIFFYPPIKFEDTHDLDLHNYFIGYVATEGVNFGSMVVPSDKTGLTGVYLSGHIHIPPDCSYMPDSGSIIFLDMGNIFASDFAAAGVGGKVGQPKTLAGNGQCTGGASAGNGDLVHISITSMTPGDGNDTMGVAGQPDIGIQVFDEHGNRLKVNGPDSGTTVTSGSFEGGHYIGKFSYPLTFQLVSRTGKAPTKTGSFTEYVMIGLSID